MRRIVQIWELHDFCHSHGRVIPHTNGMSVEFTRFHCADRRHDDSNTVVCSKGIGTCEATFAGILSMNGYVVEFANEDDYLLCTEKELEVYKEESKQAEIEEEKNKKDKEALLPENPARPRGLKITRSDMVIEYKAYEKCLEYPARKHEARVLGYLTPPYNMFDYSYKRMLCKDDCIFCHCPFYSLMNFEELRHNHRSDYDEWAMEHFKNFK